MRVYFEMAKAYAHLSEIEKCKEYLQLGEGIAKKEFGHSHGVYMDYYKAFLECSAVKKELA